MLIRRAFSLQNPATTIKQARHPFHSSSIYRMRLPYIPDPPPTSSEEEERIVAAVRARRAPRPLQALDLTLLHSPPVADGWNSFLGAIRTRTSLAQDIRELAISRVAVVNRAWYEWAHHAPLAVQGGIEEGLMDKVKVPEALRLGKGEGEGFTERQWATLVYADEMTRNVEVRDETFAVLKGLFTDQEVVEITATVAAYNCVSRFLVALDGKFLAFRGRRSADDVTDVGDSGREERTWSGCGGEALGEVLSCWSGKVCNAHGGQSSLSDTRRSGKMSLGRGMTV